MTPQTMTPDPQFSALAGQIAGKYTLDVDLVCAIVEQESGWNPWAIRAEEKFFAKYVAPQFTAGKIDITEARARAFSWGLMQVMGEVAREFGYVGDLPGLCLPSNGLEIGCRVFAHKLAVNQGSVKDALQAWNGGSNPSYASEVLDRVKNYQ
ncbi:MAG: lytic transglycosylase domain-containing protein [Candidatus Acidiferrales bacterium]